MEGPVPRVRYPIDQTEGKGRGKFNHNRTSTDTHINLMIYSSVVIICRRSMNHLSINFGFEIGTYRPKLHSVLSPYMYTWIPVNR
jgi:hypothetical protein